MEHDKRKARLEALFAAHSVSVVAYARRRSDPTTADDVLSEVFAVAWRRLDEVPADAEPWLLASARRVLANSRRAERRRLALLDRLRTTTPQVAPGLATPGSAIGPALASLSERDREVVLLVAWDGLSSQEAAAVLGCSPRTFSVRLHRARKRLLAALQAQEPSTSLPLKEVCND
ncbi:MAG TPA: sigma-70 family RNA polymerase sigma factor [Solirubrobacteraceae bacterium]|nr:sigma-70 family RNA polymerase sigma factor [Solirubrobacteraceae bacterium]